MGSNFFQSWNWYIMEVNTILYAFLHQMTFLVVRWAGCPIHNVGRLFSTWASDQCPTNGNFIEPQLCATVTLAYLNHTNNVCNGVWKFLHQSNIKPFSNIMILIQHKRATPLTLLTLNVMDLVQIKVDICMYVWSRVCHLTWRERYNSPYLFDGTLM